MLCFVDTFPSAPHWLKKITLQSEAAERGVLKYWNAKLGKKADKLTFDIMGSVELEELDSRLEERPPEGITSLDLEMLRVNK